MHGEEIGVFQTPVVAVSYFGVAAVLLGCAKFAVKTTAPVHDSHEALPEPAE
jgi:hypothetical protein